MFQNILQTIDKVIPSPIIFELQFNGKIRYAAAYKRPSKADKSKRVVSNFYGTTENTEHTENNLKELPLALNMRTLYEALLKDLMPLEAQKGESLQGLVYRVEQGSKLEREITKLHNKIKKEKQFNRRVELNRMLNALKIEIEELNK